MFEDRLSQPFKRLFIFAQNFEVNQFVAAGSTLPSIYMETVKGEVFVVTSEEVDERLWLNISSVDLAITQEHQSKWKNKCYEIVDILTQGAELMETIGSIHSATIISPLTGGRGKGLWMVGDNDVDVVIRPNYSLPGSLDLRLLI